MRLLRKGIGRDVAKDGRKSHSNSSLVITDTLSKEYSSHCSLGRKPTITPVMSPCPATSTKRKPQIIQTPPMHMFPNPSKPNPAEWPPTGVFQIPCPCIIIQIATTQPVNEIPSRIHLPTTPRSTNSHRQSRYGFIPGIE